MVHNPARPAKFTICMYVLLDILLRTIEEEETETTAKYINLVI